MALQTGIFTAVLADLRSTTEKRSSLENPQTPLSYPSEWLLDAFGGGRTDAGVRVNQMSAFGSSTFLACVDLISNALASLPAHIKERSTVNNRLVSRIAYDHDYFDLIDFEPNPDMTWFSYMKLSACHFLTWGNSYTEIQRDAGNNVVALWPRNPHNTKPHTLVTSTTLPAVPWRPYPVSLAAGTTVYVTKDGTTNGAERMIAPDDMIAIAGLSFDGRIGQGIVHLARERIGIDLATSKFGSKYFANFAKPSALLVAPIGLGEQQRQQALHSWQVAQGGDNAHRVGMLPPGYDFKAVSNNAQEAQLNETRKAIRTEICAVFHVPPHMVGDVAGSKATAEQNAQDFVSYTLSPWLTAITQEFKRKMFPNPTGLGIGRKPAKNAFYLDFDLHDLLRPTATDRQSFYSTGFTTGTLSPNDIRELEGMNPRSGTAGDTYYIPVNMQDAENPVVVPNPAQPEAPQQQAPVKPEAKSLIPLYSRVFRDAFGRVLSRDKADAKAFHRAFAPVLYAITDMLVQQSDPEFRTGTQLPGDVVKFVNDYIITMQHRASSWTLDKADELSNAELERAITAIQVPIARS
jgi:HK97 family phage portal protein